MPFTLSGFQPKMALFGLMGAVGCLAAAVLCEPFLLLTRQAPVTRRQPQAVTLLLDCSGSMSGAKLAEMQQAAREFVQRQDLQSDRIAVVGFGSGVHLGWPLSADKAGLQTAIAGLHDGGGTNMSAALLAAADVLDGSPLSKNILLFTDGMPDSQPETIKAAKDCSAAGIRIVAVATGDADGHLLQQLAGARELVFPADAGRFAAAFKQAEEAIYGKQLLESGPSTGGLFTSLLRIAAWTGLLAAGIALALACGQSLYLRRTLPGRRTAVLAGVGGLGAGLAAGFVGQLVFAGTPDSAVLVALGRIVAWAILGALVGLGLAFFVPNLRALRGLQGGAVGGMAGAVGFLLGALVLGDVVGRLAGAAILGFCIGLMIAFFEVAFRTLWLEIHYGPREVRAVTLGPEPITIGADQEACTIFARNAPPVALRYQIQNGEVVCEDVPASRTHRLIPGDRRTVGNVTVVVCAQRPEDASSTPPSSSSGSDARGTERARFILRVPGRAIELHEGTVLTPQDLPGLVPEAGARGVAEVAPNPKDPHVLGLKNLSSSTWTADVVKAVPPERQSHREDHST